MDRDRGPMGSESNSCSLSSSQIQRAQEAISFLSSLPVSSTANTSQRVASNSASGSQVDSSQNAGEDLNHVNKCI